MNDERLLEFDLDGIGDDAPEVARQAGQETAAARVKAEVEAAVAVLRYPNYYAHRFVEAHPSNYTPGRVYPIQYVVIHITQGSYAGSISWSQNPDSNVSWTYIVSLRGHSTQMVSEDDRIWTNSSWWHNQRSASIEHEGYHPRSANDVPDAQLRTSAKLTAGICLRNNIPIDRAHIFGHTEIRGVAKPCPSGWPWERYIRLVRGYAGKDSPAPEPGEPEEGPVRRMSRWEWCQDNSAPTPVILTYEGEDEWKVTQVSSNPGQLPTKTRWQWCQDDSAPAPVVLTWDRKPAWKVERAGKA